MLRILKSVFGLCMALSVAQQASAYVMIGTPAPWQTGELNYGADVIPRGYWSTGSDPGAPKNLGEEYRLNTPVLTYAFDASFLTYYGDQGAAAVRKAMAIMNRLPAASLASKNLTEFPIDEIQQRNYRAEAAGLFDVTSMTLSLMLEHLGLGDQSHVFDLRGRSAIASTLPCQFTYGPMIRNFDPITSEPSSYVNGVLYDYDIVDLCSVGTQIADAVETTADTTAQARTTVASWRALRLGRFYTQISRDDMGGLRYLYRRNNYNNDVMPAGTTVSRAFTTVNSPWNPIVVVTNLAALTNSIGVGGATGAGITNGVFCGVEKITFREVKYDSTFGTTFTPIVIPYTQFVVISNKLVTLNVSRTITQPDIIFSAGDLATPPVYTLFSRSQQFVNNAPNGGFGPGNVVPQMNVTFDDSGVFGVNETDAFLEGSQVSPRAVWGSFDGTTNDPVVYPKWKSIRDAEAQVLGQQ